VNSRVSASNNYGKTARSIAKGLPDYTVFAMTVQDTLLFVASDGHGIWTRPLSQIVPVTLSFVTAKGGDGLETITWRTEREVNTQGFDIQRRETRGAEWNTVGFVRAKGSSAQAVTYGYAFHPGPTPSTPRQVYYRLKIIDYDGSFEYSSEVELLADDAAADFRLYASYPNPAGSRAVLTFTIPRDAPVRFTIVNLLGAVVRTVVDENLFAGSHTYQVETSTLPRGVYHSVLKAGDRELIRRLIVE
jgi:hypothetical protein